MPNIGKPRAGIDPSYIAENKWWLYLPFKTVLGDAYPNLEQQVEQFYLPAVDVGSNDVYFKGYAASYPANKLVNSSPKTLKFRYIIDADWYNYSCLYSWAVKLGVLNLDSEVNKTTQTLAHAETTLKFMTCRLYLLSPFKQKIVEFIFDQCFLKNFGELLMTYQDSKPMTHDITFTYNYFKIDRPSIVYDRGLDEGK